MSRENYRIGDTEEYLLSYHNSHDDVERDHNERINGGGSREIWLNPSVFENQNIYNENKNVPFVFSTLWFHFLPTILLVIPYYIYQSADHSNQIFQKIENLMDSRMFVNLFYASWVLVFLLTLMALHLRQNRIRNIVYSVVYYLILTFEFTLLMVFTIIYVGSHRDITHRIASFQIGVVLINLIIIFFLSMITEFIRCGLRRGYSMWMHLPIIITYTVLEIIGTLMYGSVVGFDSTTQISSTYRAIAILISSMTVLLISITLLLYLSYAIAGRHSLFVQNRQPILIDFTEYDSEISFTSYVVSIYNDLARFLKLLIQMCIRLGPSHSNVNSSRGYAF